MTASPDHTDVRFLLVVLDQFNMLPFGGFLDKLRFSADEEDYSQQRYCQWNISSLKHGTITSSSGVAVETEFALKDAQFEHYDYVVVFGSRGATQSMENATEYKPLLKKAVTRGATLVAIDNASFLFAACRLLNGHSVVVHWRHEQEFASEFPDIPLLSDQLYHVDKNRITCVGGTAAIELAVELISRHCGRQKALKGLADMFVDEARQSQHGVKSLSFGQDGNTASPAQTKRAIALMRQMLSKRQTIDVIASEIGISRRQLDRLFMEAHDTTAKGYWLKMRLGHAHWRINNSSLPLGQIAEEIGIGDVSYFCKQFKRHYGINPAELRRTKHALSTSA
ncbi:helix-turn-helix domain-containing protein [Vibrio mediterranei]|uniref:GlxA family transcriptional regulator n=1 Tax=Vibrio mediterranei TaxID=689 RepID=UPI0017994140|nr:helix-turn-helix domain-containing protein [Vibrio mediterranei]NUW75178.1 helix-turn-helix domain-containing protein [Vibrio mediterranei]